MTEHADHMLSYTGGWTDVPQQNVMPAEPGVNTMASKGWKLEVQKSATNGLCR